MPPVIKIEIEAMKGTLNTMLSQRAAMLSDEMQKAVNTFCEPERIEKLITETAHRELEAIVKAEIASFFQYGAGRKSIKDSVQAKLNEMFKDSE